MNPSPARYPRVNIYLDSLELTEAIKIAAVRRGVSISAYCLEAIRARLKQEGLQVGPTEHADPRAAAEALDRLWRKTGPVGIPADELIREGRRM